MDSDLWTYPETVGRLDVTGFEVEATDGSIGKVKEFSNDAGESYLVVDTGVWIFGKTVLLPAGREFGTISSSLLREVAFNGADISLFVTDAVNRAVLAKVGR